MATKSYNLGRVVGWSSYEEFLKENPDVDPSIVTAQRYYSATTYGVSRIVSVPTTGWSGTNILTKTVQVPGAIWGVVPILGLCYDEAQGMVPGTGADTNKQNYERAASNIFACYVSDASGNKVTNATSTSGYITFCAYPALATVTGISSIPFIVRGLGVEALTDNQAYWGPEGIVTGGAGSGGTAEGVVTRFERLVLSDSSPAFIIEMESADADTGTLTTRKYLSFAGTDGIPYNPEGSQTGIIDLTLPQNPTALTRGRILMDWDDLLRALVSSRSLGLDIADAISNLIEGDVSGIDVVYNKSTRKTQIINTAPYNADESKYTLLYQGGVNLPSKVADDKQLPKNCHYWLRCHNSFESFDSTADNWASNTSSLGIATHPYFSAHPITCYVRVLKSQVMVDHSAGGIARQVPKSIQMIIGVVSKHDFMPQSGNTAVKHQFYLAKNTSWTYGQNAKRTGFFIHQSDNTLAPSFALAHTDDPGSSGWNTSAGRWNRGAYSWVLGVNFSTKTYNGIPVLTRDTSDPGYKADKDYRFIHDLLSTGYYKVSDTTQGSTGIWNISSKLPYDAQTPANSGSSTLGASWEANANVVSGLEVAGCDDDLLIYVSSYADGYNNQLSQWSLRDNSNSNNNVYGSDLYSKHINLKVSCTLTYDATP